jgi:hypothetical protein
MEGEVDSTAVQPPPGAAAEVREAREDLREDGARLPLGDGPLRLEARVQAVAVQVAFESKLCETVFSLYRLKG